MKVLVVDDDELICENIKSKLGRILGASKLDCLIATNVVDAKRIVRSVTLDFVITDLNMPGISGLELVKYVHTNYPSTRIYVLSGYDDYNLVRRAFLSGAEDYLLKPLSIEELQEKILHRENGTDKKVSQQSSLPQMESVLKFIENNLSRELTMNEVADYAAMSYTYFSRRFKEETGHSFPEYVNIRRVNLAKSYLEDPSLRISDIAYKVGYSSASTFSKAFKKYEGCFPTDYRMSAVDEENESS